jgi:GxxExxY protein
MTEILYEQLSYLIIGAAFEVHRQLGPGFLEAIYERALAIELSTREIRFRQQAPLTVSYKGSCIGEYRAEFVIDDKIVVEVKSVSALTLAHEAQALHYLAVTGLRLAILINFGSKSLQSRRIIR